MLDGDRFVLVKIHHDAMGYFFRDRFGKGRKGGLYGGGFQGIVVAGAVLDLLFLHVQGVAHQHGRAGHANGYAYPD